MTKEARPKKLYTQADMDSALETARKTSYERGYENGFQRGQRIGKHETRKAITAYLTDLGWIGILCKSRNLTNHVSALEPVKFARASDVQYVLAEDLIVNTIITTNRK